MEFQLEKQAIPFGPEGGRWSIGKIAQRAFDAKTDPDVRVWTLAALHDARTKGKAVDTVLARANVLLDAIRTNFTYAPDPAGTEYIVHPKYLAKKIMLGGDCFAEGTLLLADFGKLVPIEHIEVGKRIWGLNGWVRVEAIVPKGIMPIDVVTLSNGAKMRLTRDHHVSVLVCPEHPTDASGREPNNNPCSCPHAERVPTRMRVGDLQPHMLLPQPKELPSSIEHQLVPRASVRKESYFAEMLRVRRIDRDAEQVPCWDIQTEDHHVYLPEHDVTVLNCDDLTIFTVTVLLAALLSSGARCAVVGHAYDKSKSIGHVLGALWHEGRWHYVDPSDKNPVGKLSFQPTHELVYDVFAPEEPICDATSCLVGARAARPAPLKKMAEYVGVNGLPTDSIELDPASPAPIPTKAPMLPSGQKLFAAPTFDAPPPRAIMAASSSAPAPSPTAAGQDDQYYPALLDYVRSLRTSIDGAWKDVIDTWDNSGEIARKLGYAWPPEGGQIYGGDAALKMYLAANDIVSLIHNLLTDAIDGRRELVFFEKSGRMTLGLKKLASDTESLVSGGLNVQSILTGSWNEAQMQEAGETIARGDGPRLLPRIERSLPASVSDAGVAGLQSVDVYPVHPAIIVVVAGAVVLSIALVMDTEGVLRLFRFALEQITHWMIMGRISEWRKDGMSTEEINRTLETIYKGRQSVIDADTRGIKADAEKMRAKAEQLKWIAIIAGTLAAGALGTLGYIEAKPWLAARRAAKGGSGG
jgi:hypothetical protein